jgi:hypothetical protein
MMDKSAFTTDEWNLIVATPLLAGMAITFADPSGLWGMLQEGMATARSMLQAKSAPSPTLEKAVAEELSTSEGRSRAQELIKTKLTGRNTAELKQQILSQLKAAGHLLDQKAGVDALVFKSWLKTLADSVAKASREGGFLGFGGVQISESETATLKDIAEVLDVT